MKKAISSAIVLVMAALVFAQMGGVNYVPEQTGPANLLTGLLLASPVFGLCYLVYCFFRWHLSFHRRMKGGIR